MRRILRSLSVLCPILCLLLLAGCKQPTTITFLTVDSGVSSTPAEFHPGDLLIWKSNPKAPQDFTISFYGQVAPCTEGKILSGAQEKPAVCHLVSATSSYNIVYTICYVGGGCYNGNGAFMPRGGNTPCKGCLATVDPGGHDTGRITPVPKTATVTNSSVTFFCDSQNPPDATPEDVSVSLSTTANTSTITWVPTLGSSTWNVQFTSGSPCTAAVGNSNPTCTIDQNATKKDYPYTMSVAGCSAASASTNPALAVTVK